MTAPTRAPRKRTASKAAPKAAEKVEETTVVLDQPEETKQRVTFVMEQKDDTKTYRKFSPPADSGCVGTLYVPLGTEEVKVLLVGPK